MHLILPQQSCDSLRVHFGLRWCAIVDIAFHRGVAIEFGQQRRITSAETPQYQARREQFEAG